MNAFVNFLPDVFWIIIVVASVIAWFITMEVMNDNNCSNIQMVSTTILMSLFMLFSLIMIFKAPEIKQYNNKRIEQQQLSKDIIAHVDSIVDSIVESKVNQRLKELSTSYKYHVLAESK